jgi:predicted MPP superfamily phosphohydrolase
MSTPVRRGVRARYLLGHRLGVPVHRLFNLLIRGTLGFSRLEVSSLQFQHPLLAGRRAVHITDLHLDRYLPRHDRILQVIADLSPDWVFVTGDLLTVPEGLPHLFRFLSRLRECAPVYLTLGNHDHYSGVPLARYRQYADQHDLDLLMNEARVVRVASGTRAGELAIVGLDDPSLHRADVSCIPAHTKDRFTVLLAHAPNILDLLEPAHAVDVILCGHSHGGQWRIRHVPPLWLPYGCRGRASGHYSHNGHQLYVNRGLGWSLLPVRWNCPPEIVLIEWSDSAEPHRPRTSSEPQAILSSASRARLRTV